MLFVTECNFVAVITFLHLQQSIISVLFGKMYLRDKIAGSCYVESQLQRKAYGSFVRALTETIMHQQCEQGKNIAAWSEILIRNTWYGPCLGMVIWKIYLLHNYSICIFSSKTRMLVGSSTLNQLKMVRISNGPEPTDPLRWIFHWVFSEIAKLQAFKLHFKVTRRKNFFVTFEVTLRCILGSWCRTSGKAKHCTRV